MKSEWSPRFPTKSIAPVPRLALSIDELAAALGVSPRTIATWVKDGSAPPSFIQGRLRLFPTDGVSNWLAQQVQDADSNGTPN